MKSRLQIAVSVSTVSIALLFCAFNALSQQRAAPALPGAPAGAGRGGQAARGAPAAQGGRGAALPGTENGWSLFQTRCASCHLNPAVDLATPGTVLRQMTPEKIYASLTTGTMKEKSEGITDPQKRRIAEFLSGRPMGHSRCGHRPW